MEFIDGDKLYKSERAARRKFQDAGKFLIKEMKRHGIYSMEYFDNCIDYNLKELERSIAYIRNREGELFNTIIRDNPNISISYCQAMHEILKEVSTIAMEILKLIINEISPENPFILSDESEISSILFRYITSVSNIGTNSFCTFTLIWVQKSLRTDLFHFWPDAQYIYSKNSPKEALDNVNKFMSKNELSPRTAACTKIILIYISLADKFIRAHLSLQCHWILPNLDLNQERIKALRSFFEEQVEENAAEDVPQNDIDSTFGYCSD